MPEQHVRFIIKVIAASGNRELTSVNRDANVYFQFSIVNTASLWTAFEVYLHRNRYTTFTFYDTIEGRTFSWRHTTRLQMRNKFLETGFDAVIGASDKGKRGDYWVRNIRVSQCDIVELIHVIKWSSKKIMEVRNQLK